MGKQIKGGKQRNMAQEEKTKLLTRPRALHEDINQKIKNEQQGHRPP